ncbi:cytochrome c oxidase assembly protein COX19-like [Amphiura filiformis]|uniref:cytochrome c oxidase assembly protein COX19-like n=1 Tax=Amphiura filiformis TaxID=82378 RepID=UPI003B21D9D7
MAGAYNMQQRFNPSAPDRGSFPLDHEGECKKFKQLFMTCLAENKGRHNPCRVQAKEYLECRMDKELMTREPLNKLGFSDLENKEQQKST